MPFFYECAVNISYQDIRNVSNVQATISIEFDLGDVHTFTISKHRENHTSQVAKAERAKEFRKSDERLGEPQRVRRNRGRISTQQMQ